MKTDGKQTFALPGEIEDEAINIGELLRTLWRGKLLIAISTVICVLIGGYYAYSVAVPLYQATAVVVLETKQESIVDLQSVVGGFSGDSKEMNTELEVLRSRGLAGQVVDELNLINDPEFNGTLTPPSTLSKVIAAVRSILPRDSAADAARQTPEMRQAAIRNNAITALLRKVSVDNLRQSLVFNVSAESQSPVKSALISDTFVAMYIQDQIEVKFEATEQATTWLSNRVSELQVDLEVAEKKVSDFTAQTELVSVESLQGLERQSKDLRDRIIAGNATIAALESRLDGLNAAETPKEKAALIEDPILTRMALSGLNDGADREAFDRRYQIAIARVSGDLIRGRRQVAALKASGADMTRQVEKQAADLITLQQLTRESEATRLLYEYFLTRLKETSAQEGIQRPDSRLLSSAVVPNFASAPDKSRLLLLSLVAGLLIGSALVLTREYKSSTFRTADGLEQHTGYTVLGQIPIIPNRQRTDTLTYLSDKPTSAAAEAVRNLRTSLMLSDPAKRPQVIVSTSSIPGEGKTTNSLALAKTLQGLGKSVLLIEGDIRRRTLNEYFGTLPTTGIASVLSGDIRFEDAVHRPDGFGADILAGEKSSVNAADIFSSDKFHAFIKEMRGKYDYILIDTPPVLVVPDARIIAAVADAVLFTVKWDSTSKALVDESIRMFHNSGQRISGLILSQINERGMKKYGHTGTYGTYGNKYYTN